MRQLFTWTTSRLVDSPSLWTVTSILTAFLGLTIFSLVTCTPPELLREKIPPLPTSNKKMDVPKYDNGKPFVYWYFDKQKESQLKLTQPETSPDSLLIRIWVAAPTTKKNQRHQLVEIRRANNNWTGQVINMSVDFKMNKLEETITNYSATQVKPITSWKTVIDSLFYFKIDSLPTDENLPNYISQSTNYSNRAPTFSFEFSTPNIYRFYQYNNVWYIMDKYWQAKNVVKITNLLDREFRVDSLYNEFYKTLPKK